MGAMHEMLHAAGAPHVGNAPDDIMSGPDVLGYGSSVPTLQDIQNILQAGGKGVTGNLPGASSTFFGQLSSGAPYVSFLQEPGFTGPTFTGMGEYIGGYGGYFDSSGNFNGVLGDVGGYNIAFYGTALRDHAAAENQWSSGLVNWNKNMWGGNTSSGAPWLEYAQR